MTKWAYIAIVIALAVGLGAGYGMWGGGGSAGAATVTEGGSTTVQPLADRWAEAFEATHPNADVIVQGGGSSHGVRGCAEGTFDIGAASREIKESELSQWPNLVIHAIAEDGVAIVVHPSNPVASLSLDEIRDTFATGTDATWTVVSREEGSGTRETFEKLVMGEAEISANAEFLPSNGAIKQKVATTSSAIGYISLGYVDDAVKAADVDGVACTPENCRDGTYPIARTLYFVTTGEPVGEALDFINFCLGPEGQQIVEEEGYISVR